MRLSVQLQGTTDRGTEANFELCGLVSAGKLYDPSALLLAFYTRPPMFQRIERTGQNLACKSTKARIFQNQNEADSGPLPS